MAKTTYSEQEKKTLRKMFWNSGLVFSSFNMVKMEGNAFALTMEPALEELYEDKEERSQALQRHNGFFNTHAVFFALIAGITYALARQKKTTGAVTKAAGVMGITMVGAMVASSVNVKLAWTIHVGQTSVVVLDIFNSIMPGILSILLVFGLVKLIKKGYKPITLVFGILVISIVLAFFGIF